MGRKRSYKPRAPKITATGAFFITILAIGCAVGLYFLIKHFLEDPPSSGNESGNVGNQEQKCGYCTTSKCGPQMEAIINLPPDATIEEQITIALALGTCTCTHCNSDCVDAGLHDGLTSADCVAFTQPPSQYKGAQNRKLANIARNGLKKRRHK